MVNFQARARKPNTANSASASKAAPSMARQEHQNSSSSTGSHGSPSVNGANLNKPTEQFNNRFVVMTQWRTIFGCCCLLIASYFGYLGYLETRVNTPFDDIKVIILTEQNFFFQQY